jgi:hypothetical protein
MNPHTPKATPTLENGLPMDSRTFRGRLQGQNSIAQRVPYINEKRLERRCLKWARMTHLDIWNTSYGQKKGQESNWQFDSWPLKVRNQPNSLMCRWRATYCWKRSRQGLQLSFKPDLNRRSTREVMGPQSWGRPNFGNFETPKGGSWDKMSFGCGPCGEAQSIL